MGAGCWVRVGQSDVGAGMESSLGLGLGLLVLMGPHCKASIVVKQVGAAAHQHVRPPAHGAFLCH